LSEDFLNLTQREFVKLAELVVHFRLGIKEHALNRPIVSL
jgi:hypothetical protein